MTKCSISARAKPDRTPTAKINARGARDAPNHVCGGDAIYVPCPIRRHAYLKCSAINANSSNAMIAINDRILRSDVRTDRIGSISRRANAVTKPIRNSTNPNETATIRLRLNTKRRRHTYVCHRRHACRRSSIFRHKYCLCRTNIRRKRILANSTTHAKYIKLGRKDYGQPVGGLEI